MTRYKNNLSILIVNAIIAAIYVVLTFSFSAFSFGVIQVRIATGVYQLVAYDKRYYIGCVLGVVIANLISSPLGIADVFAGLGVTALGLLIAILVNQFIKNSYLRGIIIAVCVMGGMIFVALELHILLQAPLIVTFVYLALGQMISQTIGFFIFKEINKRFNLAQLLISKE